MPKKPERIRLLGPALGDVDNRGIRLPDKARVLVAALTLQPRHALSRQTSATLLWENADQSSSRANLRQLLARTKKSSVAALSPISMSGDTLSLSPAGKNTDLFDFLQGLQVLERNGSVNDLGLFEFLKHYSGELLHDFNSGESDLDFWVTQQRRLIEDSFLTATKRYFDALTFLGCCDPSHLCLVAARLLSLRPDDEEAIEAVIAAYSRSGSPDLQIRAREMISRLPNSTSSVPAEVAKRETISRLPTARAASELPIVAFLASETFEGAGFDWVIHAFTADVANSLSRFRSFQVLSVDSSFQIGKESEVSGQFVTLDRDYTVSSYGLPGEDVVCFRMLDERSRRVVWSAEYSLDPINLKNSFRFLSKHVAQTIGDQVERLRADCARLTGTSQSYLAMLQGNSFMKQSGLIALRRARKSYKDAHEQSETWAEPLAKIAQTMQLEWLLLGRSEPAQLQAARALAVRAVELDPFEPVTHWMQGVAALYQRDFETADRCFRESECLAPNNAEMLLQFADAKSHYGEVDESWKLFKRATALNPLAPDRHWWVGAGISFVRGEYEEAVSLCHRMKDVEPALRVYTASLALLGRDAEARDCGRRLKENYPGLNATEIVALIPDHDRKVTKVLEEGLSLAGV